jgi:cell division protein FtsA
MFFTKYRNFIVALEVGSSKIAAAVGELRADGSLALLGVGEANSSKVRKCEIVDFELASDSIKAALCDAELKTDLAIKEVYLSISGSHLRAKNIRVSTLIDSEGNEIFPEHLAELEQMAKDDPLPAEFTGILRYRQNYYLDDGSPTENPVGLSSKKLAADYHIAYGLATRAQTTIRALHDLSIEVKGFALSSYATAQAVLNKAQKHLGAVVINCGGGVTDYIVYQDGKVLHTGVLGVGGDHVTNDIVLGLKLSWSDAERLKRTEGSVVPYSDEKNARITLPGSYYAQERQIYRDSLVTIMQARQAETLEIILQDLKAQPFWADFNGEVHFTGGAAQVKGLVELAREIFPCPCRMAGPCPFDGDQNYSSRPDLMTVLGLLHYARLAEMESPTLRGFARLTHSVKTALAGMKLF